MGELQPCREGLNLDMLLLQPLRYRMPTGTVLSINKRDKDCSRLWGSRLVGEGPAHSWQVDYVGPMLGRCPLSSARPPGVPSKLCSGCCSRPPGADAGAPWRLLGAPGQLSRTAPCPPACVLSAGTPAGGVLVPACAGSPSSLQGCRLYWLVVLSDRRPFFSLLIPISGWTLAQSRNTVSVWRKNAWTLDPPWPAGSRIFGCVFTV